MIERRWICVGYANLFESWLARVAFKILKIRESLELSRFWLKATSKKLLDAGHGQHPLLTMPAPSPWTMRCKCLSACAGTKGWRMMIVPWHSRDFFETFASALWPILWTLLGHLDPHNSVRGTKRFGASWSMESGRIWMSWGQLRTHLY